ncbi:hypothetical protein NDU88_003179, partial [Pleurodeles waltl]
MPRTLVATQPTLHKPIQDLRIFCLLFSFFSTCGHLAILLLSGLLSLWYRPLPLLFHQQPPFLLSLAV